MIARRTSLRSAFESSRLRLSALATMVSIAMGCAASASGADTAANDASDLTVVDTGVNVGRCGQSVYDCLCACDGGCVSGCLAMTSDCLTCVNDGVTSCCPTEYPAYNQCFADATTAPDGGTAACAESDSQCISMRCEPQAAALQDCLATPRCHDSMSVCTGTWPATCGR